MQLLELRTHCEYNSRCFVSSALQRPLSTWKLFDFIFYNKKFSRRSLLGIDNIDIILFERVASADDAKEERKKGFRHMIVQKLFTKLKSQDTELGNANSNNNNNNSGETNVITATPAVCCYRCLSKY